MKFLSDRWFSEYEETLRKEFSPEKITTHESYRMRELYRNCPNGKDRWLLTDIERGVLFEFSQGKVWKQHRVILISGCTQTMKHIPIFRH